MKPPSLKEFNPNNFEPIEEKPEGFRHLDEWLQPDIKSILKKQ